MRGTFVVLGFETCGRELEEGGRMVEVAAARIVNGRVAKRYESLANAAVKLSRAEDHPRGITQEMVDEAPPASEVMQQLIDFIGRDPVIAHEAELTRRVFDSECAHAGLHVDVRDFLCSMQLARRVYPYFRSHTLPTLALGLGLYGPAPAQRIAAEVELTATLAIQLGEQLRTSLDGIRADEPVLRQIMDMPPKHAAFMFGNPRSAVFAPRCH